MGAVDRFFDLYTSLKAELDPDYERVPDDLIDLEAIQDRVWSKNPGDDFWLHMIAAFKEFNKALEVAQIESRLQCSRCFEVFHGFAFLFVSQTGTLVAKARGAYSEPVYLGASECSALAIKLRELADSCQPPTGEPGRWKVQKGEAYVEITAAPAWSEFESCYARDLATELEQLSIGVPAESPPLEYGRHQAIESMGEVARLASTGMKIQAVKMYRKLSGKGLDDAIVAVDKMCRL